MSYTNLSGWASLNYAAAFEQADEATQDVMAKVWNARTRAARAQAARAKKKSGPFDSKVRSILQNIETRRGPVPARSQASLIASAILRAEGGNVETIQRQVRRSLERQGLR